MLFNFIHYNHPQLIFCSVASNLTLTMLCLWVGAGVGVHVKFTGWRAPRSTHPYPEAKLALCSQLLLQLLFYSAVCALLFSPVRAAGSGLGPAAYQLSSAFYRRVTSVWMSPSLEREEREWGRESITECRMGGRRERERGAVSTLWLLDREREREMGGEGCGSAEFPLWSILHSAYFFLIIKRRLTFYKN